MRCLKMNLLKQIHASGTLTWGGTSSFQVVPAEVTKRAQGACTLGCSIVSHTYALHMILTKFIDIKNIMARVAAVKRFQEDLSQKCQTLSKEFQDVLQKIGPQKSYEEVKENLEEIAEEVLGSDDDGHDDDSSD